MSLLHPELDSLSALAVYTVVWTIVFVESGILVGFFLPGDTVLFGAGLIAGSPDSGVHVGVLAVGVAIAAIAGDSTGYWIGHRAGRPLLVRWRHRWHLEETLARTEAFYDRFGALSVVIARWIPWVRTFTPVLAGVARMAYGRFLVANVAGAISWGVALVLLGWLAARIPAVREVSIWVGLSFAVGGTVLALLHVRRLRRAAGS
ncbi:MAG: DedA family protein [Actinomycetota bacterium]|nr:DedA family protein [Actinomycetota bacterium]